MVLGGLLAVSLLAGVGFVAHVSAVLGRFAPWVALVVGGSLGAGAWWAVARLRPDRTIAALPRADLAAGVVLVVVVLWTAFAAWAPSQHVVLDRDPASYLNTAAWLAGGGDLQAEVARGGLEVLEGDEVTYRSIAVYVTGPGRVEFQFVHQTSALLAVATTVGGAPLALRLPALAAGLGLLAVWVVATLATRRPLLALFPVGLLGLGLPLLFAARDTFSEPFSLALVWWAAVLLLAVHERPAVAPAALGGFALGCAVAVRADALLFVAAAVGLSGCSILAAQDDLRRRRLRAGLVALAAGAIPVVFAAIDLVAMSGRYFEEHVGTVTSAAALVVLALAAVTAALVVARVRPAWVGRVRPVPRDWAIGVGVLVVAAFAFAWFVRPHVQELRFDEGPPRFGGRSYYEDTAVWLSWYLGVVGFALAIVGAGWATIRALRARAPSALVAVLVTTLGLCSIYLVNASVTPEQLWASRRFLPGILPGLAVLAACPILWWLRRSSPSPRWRLAVASVVVLAALVPLAVTTWPLRNLAQQRGYLDVVLDACDQLGPDATVLVVDPWGADTVAQTLRSWCGVPVGVPGPGFDDAARERLLEAVESSGRRLVLVAGDGPGLAALPWASGESVSTRVVENPVEPDRTETSYPSGYLDPSEVNPPPSPEGFRLWIRPVRP